VWAERAAARAGVVRRREEGANGCAEIRAHATSGQCCPGHAWGSASRCTSGGRHQAGLAGHGGSSYIDTVVLRDKDSTNGWTGLGDGTREQRHYYAQNWRADVSAIFDSSGEIQEWDKYRAYGVAFLLTPGDHNKDGAVAKADSNAFDADYAAGNLRADLNKSGSVTTADQTIFNASYAKAVVGGRWKLSAPDIANRKGYAGYEHDGDGGLPELAHVRYRVLHFGLGRWTRRDPAGYVDGANAIAYVHSSPVSLRDPDGLCPRECPDSCARRTGYSPSTPDGCTLVPDLVFGDCCSSHDRCYRNCQLPSAGGREGCDSTLCTCMDNACNLLADTLLRSLCLLASMRYCAAIQAGAGLPAWQSGQSASCQCGHTPETILIAYQ